MSTLVSVLGFIGAGLVLLGYLQVSRHVWKPRSLAFQLCNIIGSGLLLFYGCYVSAWPNVVLNAIWLMVGLSIVLRLSKVRKR
ncbi:MAG TPA: hypothetical protein VF572_02655 [Candidatus Saccharimonadales bacterium]|jgi:hypothetical protein